MMRTLVSSTAKLVTAFLLLSLIAGCAATQEKPDMEAKGVEVMKKAMVILYVADQAVSKSFYQAILKAEPILDVPGMTEFPLADGASLGLMPEAGTASFLGDALPAASSGNGIPRCELYLFVGDPEESYRTLVASGGKGVSEASQRPWGDVVAYGADPDGHVIAFAKAAGN